MKFTIDSDAKNAVLLAFDTSTSEGKIECQRAMKATDAFLALWSISQQVFRAARKHGYGDPELNALLEEEKVVQAIGRLEHKFYEILEEYNVNPHEYLD